eukprot:gene6326-12801_t
MERELKIPFPGEPYPQQVKLMDAIYYSIDSSSIGILESPTGTGKTLSVISSVLHWLLLEEERIRQTVQSPPDKLSLKNDEWLDLFQSSKEKLPTDEENKQLCRAKKAISLRNDILNRIGRLNFLGASVPSSHLNIKATDKTIPTSVDLRLPYSSTSDESICPDSEFLLEEYSSDKEDETNSLSSEDDSDDDSDDGLPKLIYCSRTHSQVAQFVTEIKRTMYSKIRCITLGSRKNLCVNENITRNNNQKSDAFISERCLELQKKLSSSKVTSHSNNNTHNNKNNNDSNGTKKQRIRKSAVASGPCPYHNSHLEEQFVDNALSKILDIEELFHMGKVTQTCPYYSTRRAVKYAQVVCMPYNMLLQEDMRRASGVHLKGHVVVFDEAHNLIEAVTQIHSAEISLNIIRLAYRICRAYLDRFRSQLNGRNFFYVSVLANVLKSLQRTLETTNKADNENPLTDNKKGNDTANNVPAVSASTSTTASASVSSESTEHNRRNDAELLNVNDFLFLTKLDNVNLFKLRRHILTTHLVRRIGGFGEALIRKEQEEEQEHLHRNHQDNLHQSNQGLKTSRCGSGSGSGSCGSSGHGSCHSNDTSSISANGGSSSTNPTAALRDVLSFLMKYVLLNPHQYFKPIVQQARSVILLGGTLQPFHLLSSFLFPDVAAERIRTFSCGHVVAKENVNAVVVTCGPSIRRLEIRHETRLRPEVIREICVILQRICAQIPFGVVAFFTSYSYLEMLLERWKRDDNNNNDGGGGALLDRLTSRRPVFVEPRDASQTDKVWSSYKLAAETRAGALLLCVIGGKLSEGINFSDHLARGVVVVGMPYPDTRDLILQEKLRFADTVRPNSRSTVYEAMCMKAVNQSIGRAVRHSNDYASIVLVDARYAQDRVQRQLPAWIGERTTSYTQFDDVEMNLKLFFKNK